MARVYCDTHASIGCQRAGASPQNADRPTRRHARRWGDLASPSGDGRKPWTSRPRVVPSRLHAVVPHIPRTPPAFVESIQAAGPTADPGALPADLEHAVESERHATAPRRHGRAHSALLRHGSRCRGGRQAPAGRTRWRKHCGVHEASVLRWFELVRYPESKKVASPWSNSEHLALLRRLSGWLFQRRPSNRGPTGRDSRSSSRQFSKCGRSAQGRAQARNTGALARCRHGCPRAVDVDMKRPSGE
jgi:hypothetical protein